MKSIAIKKPPRWKRPRGSLEVQKARLVEYLYPEADGGQKKQVPFHHHNLTHCSQPLTLVHSGQALSVVPCSP